MPRSIIHPKLLHKEERALGEPVSEPLGLSGPSKQTAELIVINIEESLNNINLQ